jgi:hypothetical protein
MTLFEVAREIAAGWRAPCCATIDDLEEAELCYTPQFDSANDQIRL